MRLLSTVRKAFSGLSTTSASASPRLEGKTRTQTRSCKKKYHPVIVRMSRRCKLIRSALGPGRRYFVCVRAVEKARWAAARKIGDEWWSANDARPPLLLLPLLPSPNKRQSMASTPKGEYVSDHCADSLSKLLGPAAAAMRIYQSSAQSLRPAVAVGGPFDVPLAKLAVPRVKADGKRTGGKRRRKRRGSPLMTRLWSAKGPPSSD